MSWLSDASANRIIQSYAKNFVDVSGNFKVRNAVTSSGGGSSIDITGASWTQLGSDIDGLSADAYYGYATDLNSDGTIFAAGGYNYYSATGYASVYQYSGGNWSQLGSAILGERRGDSFGIGVALNDDGTILAVGAYNNTGINGKKSGHARVYEYNGSDWVQLGSDIDGEAAYDFAGVDVALNGDGTILAVGANLNDGAGGSNSGHVRIFEYSGGSWTQLGSDIDGEARDDQFGVKVALSNDGTIVAAGATANDGGGSNAGHVRIFEYSGGSWSQLGSDIDGEGSNSMSGWAIDLSKDGSSIIIGSIENSTGPGGSRAGEARVFKWDGSSWNQVGSDIHGDSSDDRLGIGVAINDDGRIIGVGARFADGTGGTNSGIARIFYWDGTSWNQIGGDISGEASDDQGGNSIALSDDGTIFVWNAYFNDGNGSNAGHVRVYDGGFTGTDASSSGNGSSESTSITMMDVTGGTVSMLSNTMDISSAVVDISGTTWINRGQSGATIADAYQGSLVIESSSSSSSDAVLYVDTAGQAAAFSIRANGDLYSANTLRHSSDDRRKINEQYITNATETIKKLSPQTYTKLNDLVQNGGTPTKTESGLIAQEIYYNAPELRHLVHTDGEPLPYDLSGNDIQNDPDYSALGWGNKSATVDYIGLIPYLIKSNQEQQEIIENKTQVLIDNKKTLEEDLQTRISALEA